MIIISAFDEKKMAYTKAHKLDKRAYAQIDTQSIKSPFLCKGAWWPWTYNYVPKMISDIEIDPLLWTQYQTSCTAILVFA